MSGSQETTKELDSGIESIHGCFTKKGDYILSCELLQVNVQNKSQVSCDLPCRMYTEPYTIIIKCEILFSICDRLRENPAYWIGVQCAFLVLLVENYQS